MSISVTIPETSTSSDGKYTIYHIQVLIDGKNYVLKKRYSDFANLKEELESLYSDSIPYSFPRKKFLRNSVTNSLLIKERQDLFESFLNNIIIDEQDIKWRKSVPFKEFLNLPPSIFSNVSRSTKEHIHNAWSLSSLGKDEPITDLTQWIDIAREIKEILSEAKSKVFTSPSDTRKKLIFGKSRFEALEKGLEQVRNQELIGEGEAKRRFELLQSLRREHKDIEHLLSSISQFPDEKTNFFKKPIGQVKNQLFKGRVLGEPQETERTIGLGNQQLLQLQKNDFKNQDEQLEELGKTIQRQKQLGIAINEELQLQNELLDELDNEVENTSIKLKYANKRVGKFT